MATTSRRFITPCPGRPESPRGKRPHPSGARNLQVRRPLEERPGHYRSKEEVAAWRERDPIKVYENALLEQGHLSAEEIDQIKAEIDRKLDEAIRFAENSPSPLPEDCLNDVFA